MPHYSEAGSPASQSEKPLNHDSYGSVQARAIAKGGATGGLFPEMDLAGCRKRAPSRRADIKIMCQVHSAEPTPRYEEM